jgi:hypothetical protein
VRYHVIHDAQGRIISITEAGVQRGKDGSSWGIETRVPTGHQAVEIELDERQQALHQLLTEFEVDLDASTPSLRSRRSSREG